MLADHDRLAQAERESCEVIRQMEHLSPSLALAKQVVGLRDDRMKKELAVLVVEFLKAGNSAAAAEWYARGDTRFAKACAKIMAETAAAQETINQWELLRAKFENAQALRNDERAKLKML